MMNRLLAMAAAAVTFCSVNAASDGVNMQYNRLSMEPQQKTERVLKPLSTVPMLQDVMNNAPQKEAERDETGLIKFCGDLTDLAQFNTFAVKMPMTVYIPVDKQVMSMYDGVEITAIYCAVGSNSRQRVPIQIFVGESPSKYFATTEAIIPGSGEITRVEFDAPYVVDGSKTLCFGFNINAEEGDFPILTDGLTSAYGELCGAVRYEIDGYYSYWNPADANMGNLMLWAEYRGKVEPKLLPWVPFAGTTQRFMSLYSGDKVPYEIDIYNMGTVSIHSCEGTVSIDGGEPIPFEGQRYIPAGGANFIIANFDAPTQPGRYDMEFRLTKINETDVDPSLIEPFSHPLVVLPKGTNYKQRIVCEEFTGTWCGFCPVGIWGMEHIAKKYPDTYIGLPIHYDDPLEPACAMEINDRYNTTKSFPAMIVNRDEIYAGYQPHPDYLDALYRVFSKYPAIVDMQLECDITEEGTASADLTMTFGAPEQNAGYRVAMVLVERDLRASQTNYYSGGGYGPCGGWESKEYEAMYTYPETVVDMFDPMGIEGSVPAEIVAGQPIKFHYDMPLTNVKKNDNVEIVAMLIDEQTGCIVNAVKATPASSVGKINIDAMNGVEVYTISGLKVGNSTANLPAGIYLLKSSNGVQKVVIR